MISLRSHFVYFIRYTLYSGIAVICEIVIFMLLFRMVAIPPFWANELSAVAGLAMSWFIAGRHIFSERKITFYGHVVWYCYQFVAIGVYSYLVAWLIATGTHYIVSKITVLALSFALNSMFFRIMVLKAK
jgi:putative flippase GtrA